MKMTLEEAEEKKAYCGRCKHWRLIGSIRYNDRRRLAEKAPGEI